MAKKIYYKKSKGGKIMDMQVLVQFIFELVKRIINALNIDGFQIPDDVTLPENLFPTEPAE